MDNLEVAVAGALRDAKNLSEDARNVARAALVGPEALDSALTSIPGIEDVAAGDPVSAEPIGDGAHIYLSRVSVCGFRGIGDRVELPLTPAPGLVLVTGRNGSGKSSLAEACELALSRRIVRAAKSPMWSEGLTNLHRGGPAEVEIALRIDGSGDVTVTCILDSDDVAGARVTARAGDEDYDLDAHGWTDAIDRYRPVLTYGELAALASAKPSDLFDPINNIIGLDSLTAADRLLTKAATELGKPPKEATAARKALLTRLGTTDDPRAADLAAALGGQSPDQSAARAVLTGTADSPTRDRQVLAAWAALAAPDPAAATGAAESLADARGRADRASAGAVARAKRLADMLDMAIAHREHDDDMCPVCGQGRLDDAWLASARRQSKEAHEAAAEVTTAATALGRARDEARRLIPASPPALAASPVAGVDAATAAQAWAALHAVDDPDLAERERDRVLATGLAAAVERVAEETAALRSAATAALAAQDTAWEPIAEEAGQTLRLMDLAEAARTRLAATSEARSWLQALTEKLRRERMSRFETEATEIWNGLRQESNVALEGVSLTGTNTRRHVRLDLSIDGTPGPQAVLSQGELAALGLALFLPRSTAADSPLRFVLIDDPVQSMDPSKVDGLARVLHRLGGSRQIVVFTHDDRLLQALRNLALPATAYEIVRGERSVVQVRQVTDPVEQHLRDARALAKTADLPPDLVAVAVTGCCRDAIDEAALEVARRRLLDDGAAAADVDEKLTTARTTWERLALALVGNRNGTGKRVNSALDALDAEARGVITTCVDGVHEPTPAVLAALPERVRAVVTALRAA